MNLSKITKQTIIKQNLRVDKSSIIITLADSNLKIWNEIYNTGILLTNCKGIIVPNRKFFIGRKTFNGKIVYLDAKKEFQVKKSNVSAKKLKVLASIPISKGPTIQTKQNTLNTQSDHSFYFYDLTIYSQAFKHLSDKLAENMVAGIFLKELNQIYEKIKKTHPLKSIEVLTLIKNKNGTLFNILEKCLLLIKKKDFSDIKLFDNFLLVSDTNKQIIPLFYNEKGKIKPLKQNFNKLSKFLEAQEVSQEIEKEKPISSEESEKIKDQPNESIATSLIKQISKSNLKSNIDPINEEIKVELDSKELSKVLKKYKIKDPDIVTNVQLALNSYIEKTGKKIPKDKAEIIVLKAINQTVHGTDKVSEEYLSNPNLLFSKLKEINTYKVPLKFPKLDYTVSPDDIIDIDYTTGQFRQKFEFEETIHENVRKLFESLESVSSNPVKVKKIKKEIKDDDLNRFIEYTVTLQNLTGTNKKPYDVKLKVPSPVNDKYFKIKGNNYIISSQQFLKPITKTEQKDVRLLTNYAIVRMELTNLKFNPSQLDEIVNYMLIKYPTIIEKHDDKQILFKDKSIIYLNDPINIYKDVDVDIYIDEETGKLKDRNDPDKSYTGGKYEFLFEIIRNKIAEVDPTDKLTKTKKSIPYVQIYMSGIKVPLIIYLWLQKGLLHALNDFGIDYKIEDKAKGKSIAVPTSDDKFLVIYPKSFREEIIVNGLLVHKIRKTIEDLNNPEEIHDFVNQQYGTRAVYQINLMTENEIDPVTKELLEFEDLPTNLPALFTGPCLDKLLNQKPDKLSDLKIYRSRMSEIVLNLMYSQVKRAHNTYRTKAEFGDSQVYIDENFILNSLLAKGVLEYTNSVNPMSEVMLSSRVIKSGPGGVQNEKEFKPEHRNLHPSQGGIIGAESTKESGKVGLITHHTLTPIIVNKYGSYGVKHDIDKLSGWNVVAADEAITPFQNEMGSDRLVLAVTHSVQVTPISNAEKPLISTGAEYIIPQLSSKRFVLKAKKSGVIQKVDKNKTLTIKYNDGTKEILDIIPRKSQTKRGAYILLEMETLPEGTKIKANQVIAYTKNFSPDGVYCAGTNVKIAMMNYLGSNHEDSYCITKEKAEETTTSIIKELSIIVPPETKVMQLEKEVGKVLSGGEILTEFTYQSDLDDYLEINNIEEELEDEDGEVLSLYAKGHDTIKLIATPGEIVDIKVYINRKKNLDKSIINYHNKLVRDTKSVIGKIASSIPEKDKQLAAIDNLNLSFFKIGKHKVKGVEFVGARIVYSIKQNKELRVGDKLSNRLSYSRCV